MEGRSRSRPHLILEKEDTVKKRNNYEPGEHSRTYIPDRSVNNERGLQFQLEHLTQRLGQREEEIKKLTERCNNLKCKGF